MKTLISHLLGETRTAILASLLQKPDEPRHVRDLARMTGISPGTLHRELTALASYGVLRRSEVGRQVYFAADQDCPVFEDLAGLMRKTAGMVDVLRSALQPHAGRIKAAFIYGSIAARSETAHSDVDVMIVGDLTFTEAVEALASVQQIVRREVNATVMKPADFMRKRKAGDGFVSTVWKGPKLSLIGTEHELG